ncbi:TY-Chap domain-containing protein [Lentzea sp.]|uniref:TY-Chap domain-containing protein n=1 Tax=Lentzea sp. TaxID=56099 RepID=UPI002ED0C6EE
MNDDRTPGRFVRYHGVDHRLRESFGKWWIEADHAVDESFAPQGRRRFVRPITHDDVLDCFDVARPGTYRGLSVELNGRPTAHGHWVTGHGPEAQAQGFRRDGNRGPLQKLVALDDPELEFTTTVTPVPMPWKIAYDWAQFTERLTDALRDVTDHVYLIIHAAQEPRRYVQFAGAPDRLYAEAPGTDVVADADEFQLSRFEWAAPDAGQPNWSWSLRRPALTEEFARLADRCVVALRQAYGIVSPDELRYRAWQDPEGAPSVPVEFPGLGFGRST